MSNKIMQILIQKKPQKTTTMHSPETKCMPITQVGQRRGNKRFLSGNQIQQFSTVLDTCIVLSIFFYNCIWMGEWDEV